MGSTALAVAKPLAAGVEFDQEKVALIKRTIAKDATDDELEMFIARCRQTGLDPFADQIHAIKRWDGKEKREVMKIQVSIHGLRLIADRTGEYVPGPETTYEYDQGGALVSATAYVKKWRQGEWHMVSETARWEEYAQYTTDGKSGDKRLTAMWGTKPHIMLGKCAESLALRKAFPQELSGLYADEEMPDASAQARPRNERQIVDAQTGEIVQVQVVPPTPAIKITSPADGTDPLRHTYGKEIKDHIKRLGLTPGIRDSLLLSVCRTTDLRTLPTEALGVLSEQLKKLRDNQAALDWLDRQRAPDEGAFTEGEGAAQGQGQEDGS